MKSANGFAQGRGLRGGHAAPTPPAAVRAAVWWCAVVTFVFVAGCGRYDGPDVHFVRGMVFLDGGPLASATVGFTPADAAVGLPATGVTDATGAFTLTTVRGGRPNGGAMAGDYLVTIDKTVVDESSVGRERSASRDGDPGPPSPPVFRSLIPPSYGKRQASGLRATVKAVVNEGPSFRFDLKSDYKPE